MSELTPAKRSSLACHDQDTTSVQSEQSSAGLDSGISHLNLREESAGKRTRPIDAATVAGLRQSLAAVPTPSSPPLPPASVCGFVAAGPSSHALSTLSSRSHLPLPMSTAAPSPPAAAPVSEPQTVSAPKQDLLLVEDVRVSQRIARVALARARFRVEVAENGEEAVEMYRKGKFDIILMDIQLPKMNGIEATIKIREIEQKEGRPSVIIFGLTGSLSESDLASYKAAGMQGCIGKGSVLESAVPEALEEYEKKPHEFTLIKLGGLMSPAVGGRQIGIGAGPSHAPAASSLASSARASVPSTRAMGSSRSLHIGHQASGPASSPQGPVSSHAVSHSAQTVAPITTAAPPQNSASSTGLTDPSNTK